MNCPTVRSWVFVEDGEDVEKESNGITWTVEGRCMEAANIDPLFRRPEFLCEEAGKMMSERDGNDGIDRLREVVAYLLSIRPFNQWPC